VTRRDAGTSLAEQLAQRFALDDDGWRTTEDRFRRTTRCSSNTTRWSSTATR
jgi:hypothetical protein